MVSFGLAAKLKEPECRLQQGKGRRLLTAQVGSHGEVAGGLHVHQEDSGISAQEGWAWQVLRVSESISFL